MFCKHMGDRWVMGRNGKQTKAVRICYPKFSSIPKDTPKLLIPLSVTKLIRKRHNMNAKISVCNPVTARNTVNPHSNTTLSSHS